MQNQNLLPIYEVHHLVAEEIILESGDDHE